MSSFNGLSAVLNRQLQEARQFIQQEHDDFSEEDALLFNRLLEKAPLEIRQLAQEKLKHSQHAWVKKNLLLLLLKEAWREKVNDAQFHEYSTKDVQGDLDAKRQLLDERERYIAHLERENRTVETLGKRVRSLETDLIKAVRDKQNADERVKRQATEMAKATAEYKQKAGMNAMDEINAQWIEMCKLMCDQPSIEMVECLDRIRTAVAKHLFM